MYLLKWLTWGGSGKIAQSWKVPEDPSTHKKSCARTHSMVVELALTAWLLKEQAVRSLVGDQPF